MLRLTWKQAMAHRSRFVLTFLAVVLGVTFVTGALVLTDTSQKIFDDQFATASAGVDLTVRDAVSFESAMGVEVERDPLRAGLVDRVAAVPGVAEARPVAKGQGLLQVDGEAIVPRGPSMLSSWSDPPFGAFTLRSGRAPEGPDELVVDSATAEAYGIALGDTVTVQSTDEAALRVVGFAGFGDSAGLPDTTVALVSIERAQQLLGLGGRISEVLVLADEGVAGSQLQDRIGAAVGTSYDVASSQSTADASADAAKAGLSYIRIMLLALGAAALLVGGFLIANTFSIVITQRTHELAVLRAVGATGRQVTGSVWGEALLLGVAGSVTGVVLGAAAASGLREVLAAFGVSMPEGGMVVAPRTVLLAMLIGVVVTALAAAGPSRKAARVAPVEALRASPVSTGVGRRRLVTGAALALTGLACIAGVVLLGAATGLLGLGAGALLASLILLGPALAPRLARAVGRPLERLGVPGTLARQSAARAPRRTAATVMALAVSLALVSFMTVVSASVSASIAKGYQETISADLVVESARGEMLGGLAPRAFGAISRLPEVEVASRIRYGHWKDGAATKALTAVDPHTITEVAAVDMVEGDLTSLAAGGIVLAEAKAEEHGVEVGDRMTMTFSRAGERDLEVVGLIADEDAQALSTAYLVSLETFGRLFSENVDASIFVNVADDSTPGAATAALEKALVDFPTVDVRDQAGAVESRTAMIDQILGLVSVLLLFTVLIALLGITNTLALSVVERTREIGLLRAVGMTRAQLRRMIRAEATLMAGVAVLVALVAGIGLGTSVVSALGRDAPVDIVVPGGRLVLVVIGATLAGLVAGLLPARRASRMDVLAAVATR